MNHSKTNSPQTHQFSPSKSLLTSPPHPTFFYEPTSVLDPHLTSSPAVADLPPLPFDSHLLPSPPSLPDDWDPLSFLLLKDDFAPPPKPQFPLHDLPYDLPLDLPFFSNPPTLPFDQTHLDQLIRAAHAVESNDPASAHVILARLNHSPSGSPLQRAAFHFKDALLSLLFHRPIPDPPISAVDLVLKIHAHRAFSDLSPVPQFTSFTANQTLLESLDPSSRSLHLIDFDIGLGGHWSSFLQEIAERSRAARTAPPSVRITAVVAAESGETALAAENLRDFAQNCGVHITVDFVRVGGLGTLALGGIRLSVGESVAVVLTPVIFRLLGGSPESAASLLRFVRRVSPRVAVFVDTECCGCSDPGSFRRSFTAGLEFYSVVLESLDSAATGVGDEPVRLIERSLIRPRVFAAVESCGARSLPWREMFTGAGMVPVLVSEFTETQAEWLARRARIGGFQVERREGSMVLSWQGRELAATSAWRC